MDDTFTIIADLFLSSAPQRFYGFCCSIATHAISVKHSDGQLIAWFCFPLPDLHSCIIVPASARCPSLLCVMAQVVSIWFHSQRTEFESQSIRLKSWFREGQSINTGKKQYCIVLYCIVRTLSILLVGEIFIFAIIFFLASLGCLLYCIVLYCVVLLCFVLYCIAVWLSACLTDSLDLDRNLSTNIWLSAGE